MTSDTPSLASEPPQITTFRSWFTSNGGTLHPKLHFQRVSLGFNVIAKEPVPADETIVSCPISLVITPELAKFALRDVLGDSEASGGIADGMREWTERQLLCAYICLHFVFEELGDGPPSSLKHYPYISTLPSSSKLLTSLHFTPSELDLFKNTNLHHATLDRISTFQAEHTAIQAFVSTVNPALGERLAWPKYLQAATYLSSRAFPSTLLEVGSHLGGNDHEERGLAIKEGSYPVLIPGVDALNHERAKPVSWIVTHSSEKTLSSATSCLISLILHTLTPSHHELFNNYGPKPNSELILAYGFTLPYNPDDTIVLKLGGSNIGGEKWEVGREAKGIEPVWEAICTAVRQSAPEEDTIPEGDVEVVDPEADLYAAETLLGMVNTLLDKLPSTSGDIQVGYNVRLEVRTMWEHYVRGQRDILAAIAAFALQRRERAMKLAEEYGMDLGTDDDNDDGRET